MENERETAGVGVQARSEIRAEPYPAGQAEASAVQPARHIRAGWVFVALVGISVLGGIAYQRWRLSRAWPEGLIQVNGRMEGDQVTIASKFAGRIVQLFAREGDTVTKGQIVVKLDDPQTRAQIDQARANLQVALAQSQGAATNIVLTSALTNAQVLQAQGVVDQADSAISGAKADLERAGASIVYSAAMARVAEANVVTARAALEAAQANKATAEAGLASAQAQVLTAQANLRAAQSAINAAQAAYERNDHDARRLSRLFAERAVSEQSMDQALLAAQTAKAEVETARQQAAAAEAVVSARRSEVEAGRQQVAGANAAIAQAASQLAAARQQVAAANAGTQQMKAQASAARETVVQAQAKRRQALGDLKKAQTAPQQVDISRTNRAQAKAHIQQARAALDELQSVLKDLSLVSPVSGTVTTRMHDVGEVVSAGTPVLDLVDLDKLYLKAYVPENQIGKLRLGLPARIYVDAFPNTFFEANVGYIASTAEFTPKEVQTPEERVKLVYAVKLYIKNNPEHRLTPGMVADAVIQWKEREKWRKPRW